MDFSFGFAFNEDESRATKESSAATILNSKTKFSDVVGGTLNTNSIPSSSNLLHEVDPPSPDEMTLLLSKEFNSVSSRLGPIHRTNICSSSISLDISSKNNNQCSKPYTRGTATTQNADCNTNTDVSDLIPGHYEGGLKTWECSIDLCNYIIEEKCVITGETVLELGCGSGLPGIFAMKYLEAKCAYFVDFNTTVISDVTWPNIWYNLYRDQGAGPPVVPEEGGTRCFAGDWVHLQSQLSSKPSGGGEYRQNFAVIFSAETLYTSHSCQQVVQLMDFLAYPGGTAYIASKRYYFGVGGGTSEFIELLNRVTMRDRKDIQDIRMRSAQHEADVNSVASTGTGNSKGNGNGMDDQDSVWNIETVAVLEDKSSNIREILKVTYRC